MSFLALKSLRSLTIVLNDCDFACQTDSPECRCNFEVGTCRENGRYNIRFVLDYAILLHDDLASTWEQLCEHLAWHIEESSLRLCLICDTANTKTARFFTGPLHYLPPLKACSIRLSPTKNPELRNLAAETVLHLTNRLSSVPKRLSLPLEVQSRILEYTDLVPPDGLKLVWTASDGWIHVWDESTMNEPWNVIKSINPCEMCARIHDHGGDLWPDDWASYSLCPCWQFPKNLFEVSRHFYHEARRIFYSSNHFIVNGSKKAPSYAQITKDCPLFVNPIQPNVIRYLRSLQIGIASFHSLTMRLDDEDTSQCIYLTDIGRILQQNAELSRPTFTLDMSRSHDQSCRDARPSWRKERRLVESITMLKGLKEFFVFGIYAPNTDHNHEARAKIEASLERLVMGEGYDSISRGKLPSEKRQQYFGADLPWD